MRTGPILMPQHVATNHALLPMADGTEAVVVGLEFDGVITLCFTIEDARAMIETLQKAIIRAVAMEGQQ